MDCWLQSQQAVYAVFACLMAATAINLSSYLVLTGDVRPDHGDHWLELRTTVLPGVHAVSLGLGSFIAVVEGHCSYPARLCCPAAQAGIVNAGVISMLSQHALWVAVLNCA